jgi:hypothetical protein
VRKTFVIDLHAANGLIPQGFDEAAGDGNGNRDRIRALESSCPSREAMRRISEVKILRQADL